MSTPLLRPNFATPGRRRYLSAADLKREATSRWVLSIARARRSSSSSSSSSSGASDQPDRRSPPSSVSSDDSLRPSLASPLPKAPRSVPRLKPRALAPRNPLVFLDRALPHGVGEAPTHGCERSRMRVFVLIYAAYVGLLVARKNYGFWIPHAMAVLGRSKSEVAVIGSAFEMASGAGALFNGFLIDAIDPSLTLACALAASALLNLGLSRAGSLRMMAGLWGVNGLVQSVGWPCVSKVFLRAFPDPKGRGMWYSILSTSQNVGAALVPVLVAHSVAASGDARLAFYVPALLALGMSLVLLRLLWKCDQPQTTTPAAAAAAAMRARDAALAAVLASKAKRGGKDKARAAFWAMLRTDVVLNWRLWLMAVNYFAIGVIRSSLTDWSPLYLAEHKGLSVGAASGCLFAFEVGGFVGSVVAGRASDLLCHGRRGPVMAVCTAVLCPALLLLDALTDPAALLAVYFGLGALAFPVHVLLGLASREVVSPAASSTAGGLVKFVAQMGASSAGYPLGILQQRSGWRAVFRLLSAVAVAGGLATLPLWQTVARVDERKVGARHKVKGG
jgi:OPA family sugar phosphate sensor protein UhpC-like MFS transporter